MMSRSLWRSSPAFVSAAQITPLLTLPRHATVTAPRILETVNLVDTEDAVKAEAELCALLPPARWTRASDTLILHGRRVCGPKPACDRCQVRPHCAYFRQLGPKAAPSPARRKKVARA